MNAEYLDRSVTPNSSISVTHIRDRHFFKLFHYHEQVEIVAIVKSSGIRYIGDSIAEFSPGEIFVIGKDLPHMMQNPDEYFDKANNKVAESILIHLGVSFLENNFINLPEHNDIKNLIGKSTRGMLFNNPKIFSKFLTLDKKVGYQRFLSVLDILNDLGTNQDYEFIASDGFMERISKTQGSRIYQVHHYIMNNFKQDISLKKVADIANMNASAFSRYFKKSQGKPLVQYINDIKIGYACKLLMNQNTSITEACYESGFKNVSNFNRQFRKKYSMSPREYRVKM